MSRRCCLETGLALSSADIGCTFTDLHEVKGIIRLIKIGAESLKHRILGPIALIAVAVILYEFAAPSYRQGEPSVAGRKAKDFAFQDEDHVSHLTSFQGKVVVLNFWASWCVPCREELPSLNRLQEEIAVKGGVVLGANWDDDKASYANFLQANPVSFPTFRDNSRKIGQDYGTSMIPETYLIDREGRLARKIVGAQDWQSPETMRSIDILLNQN